MNIKKFINELKVKQFLIFLAIPLGVGILSYFVTKGSMDIYDRVNTPPLAPPSWLFPVVWAVLYTLMGISSYMVWNENSSYTKEALTIYGIQLAFNFMWSIFFFILEAFMLSLVWLCGLLILIVLMIMAFKRIKPAAAYLQIPYAVWVAFAVYLNAGIYLLN